MATIQIHCSQCQYKVFTDGTGIDGLVEVKKANPPLRANGIVQETFNRGKFYKCPKCGYMMKGFFPPASDNPEKKTPPDFPKDMDERMNSGKLGEDFIKQVDRYMKAKQIAEHKANKNKEGL